MSDDVLVRARGLEVHFPVRGQGLRRKQAGVLRAVDGVDLDILRGETLGLVGESGCGKSTLGNALLRLIPSTGGTIDFAGTDITSLSGRGLRELRRRAGMVFQDPFASLDPRRTVAQTVSEPLEVHGLRSGRSERAQRVGELLELVGLDPAVAGRYPHEFSGGQRQRVGIARALAGEPDFLVCDEAIASLDVSVQAQVLNLLRGLQRQLGLTLLFISHDLSAVRHISDRIAVMYLGRVVEIGPAAAVGTDPQMPYTQALLSAVPLPHPALERQRKRIVLRGDVPSPSAVPSGCRFRTRCPYVFEPCDDVDPALQPAGAPGQLAACHLHGVVGTPATAPDGVTAQP
ncbi:ABC transporter ATP-binding protein [Blastococcus atacamensis]|uniref:ABC transporter ATP-binding protein n=1 Tax=Blastococcus atacamensis TaxID=2070508 RepID=UPI000CECBAD7|nr:ABC transporter ATP-binding protein [Blastococcus atacamensis]